MPKRYIAINRRLGKTKVGYYSELCDLDKRVWELEEIDQSENPEDVPMCVVSIIRHGVVVQKPIFKSSDLVGLYVGTGRS